MPDATSPSMTLVQIDARRIAIGVEVAEIDADSELVRRESQAKLDENLKRRRALLVERETLSKLRDSQHAREIVMTEQQAAAQARATHEAQAAESAKVLEENKRQQAKLAEQQAKLTEQQAKVDEMLAKLTAVPPKE